MPDNATAVTAAPKAEKIPVNMTDGSVVEFNKKQKLVKTSTIADNGDISLRLDFNNGDVRTFSLPASSPLYAKFAAHGAEQKLGDAIAGESDIADGVISVDDLIKRLSAGDWTVTRQAGSFSGTSMLIRALIEASGKSLDDIKGFLENKRQAEKLALRRSEKLRPIIERMESEKSAKSGAAVDTNALLGELGLDTGKSSQPAKTKANA